MGKGRAPGTSPWKPCMVSRSRFLGVFMAGVGVPLAAISRMGFWGLCSFIALR